MTLFGLYNPAFFGNFVDTRVETRFTETTETESPSGAVEQGPRQASAGGGDQRNKQEKHVNNTTGANALLTRRSARGVKWEDLGKGNWIKGTITSHGVEQCKKWDPKLGQWSDEPDSWDNGDPKMQIVLELQTELRDPQDDNDTGLRTVRSGPYSRRGGRSIIDATRTALAAAGADALEEGAEIAYRWADGAGKAGDGRQFDCVYRKPVTRIPETVTAADDPFASSDTGTAAAAVSESDF